MINMLNRHDNATNMVVASLSNTMLQLDDVEEDENNLNLENDGEFEANDSSSDDDDDEDKAPANSDKPHRLLNFNVNEHDEEDMISFPSLGLGLKPAVSSSPVTRLASSPTPTQTATPASVLLFHTAKTESAVITSKLLPSSSSTNKSITMNGNATTANHRDSTGGANQPGSIQAMTTFKLKDASMHVEPSPGNSPSTLSSSSKNAFNSLPLPALKKPNSSSAPATDMNEAESIFLSAIQYARRFLP
jgi:hypothetical protein